MKILIQRVTSSTVSIEGTEVGHIAAGLTVFVGIASGDTEMDIEYLVTKMVNLRIFPDTSGKFNLSLLDIKGELLLVSQFTLLADTRHGRRPGFTNAAAPPEAERLFNIFVNRARACGVKVATGKFQEYMQVEIHNDGPVTIMLDSHDKVASQAA